MQLWMKNIVLLMANDTWDLVPLPKGRKLVRCKWVYRTKYASDGSVETLKERSVSKGLSQFEGIDYNETFSLVAKMNSIHLVLSLPALHNWEFHQMDVKFAFLHGDLQEEIYMEQPPGYVQDNYILVCLLVVVFLVGQVNIFHVTIGDIFNIFFDQA